MCETKKTLIVVYKDEMLMNQLKKMVETHDDSEDGIVGTKDDSIDIVSWTEKVWLGNKKAGNIKGKILFLGKIKGTDKLIPVIDVKFSDCGVKFGWAGNQAVVYAEPKKLTVREDYDTFLEKFSALSVPEFLKPEKDSFLSKGTNQDAANKVTPDDDIENSSEEENSDVAEEEGAVNKKLGVFKAVKKAFSSGTEVIEKMGTQMVSKSEEVFRNKSLMKRQMLFYGVVNLYNNWLDKFMNI